MFFYEISRCVKEDTFNTAIIFFYTRFYVFFIVDKGISKVRIVKNNASGSADSPDTAIAAPVQQSEIAHTRNRATELVLNLFGCAGPRSKKPAAPVNGALRGRTHLPAQLPRLDIGAALRASADTGSEPAEPLVSFNELVNTMESRRMLPDLLREAIAAAPSAPGDAPPTFAQRVRAYTHGGPVTTYALGEALAELVGSGRLNSHDDPEVSGKLCRAAIAQERSADPAFDLLMKNLLTASGSPIAADSPLGRNTKESHSVQFLRLCSLSSRRPEMNMAGVRLVIDELKPQQPFSDVHVFQAQHAFESDETQARGLLELGLKPKNLWFFPKTGARALVLDRLRLMGAQIYDAPYDLRASRNSATAPLVAFLDQAFGLEGLPATEQLARLKALQDGSGMARTPSVLLVDEGFKLGAALLDLQQSDDPQLNQKYRLMSTLCSMVAHTEGDIIKGNKAMAKAERNTPPGAVAPVLPRTVNMAQSPAKKLEGILIGHDVWLSTNQVVASLGAPEVRARRPKEALVVGYGAVSAHAQPQLQAGYDVWVWDIDPTALLRAYADHETQPGAGTGRLHIPVDRATLERVVERGAAKDDPEFLAALNAAKGKWFSHGHMVVGNTGAPEGSLGVEEFGLLPDGAILSSGASGDYEFGTKTKRDANQKKLVPVATQDGQAEFPLAGAGAERIPVRVASGDQPYYDHKVYEVHSGTADAKRLMILRGGYVINRLHGTPSEFIDVTKAMMVRSMYEAIQPHTDARPQNGLWLVETDAAAQGRIVAAVNTNLAEQGLGSLEEPNFGKVDLNWHRPAVPPSPHPIQPSETMGHTSERYVQSGRSACEAYNLSPMSFSLICDPDADLMSTSSDLRILEQQMFPAPDIVNGFRAELERPQRTVAHTLYALYAQHGGRSGESVDATVEALRVRLGIDDEGWAKLKAARDEYGLTPSDYAVMAPAGTLGHASAADRARISMQECISVLTIVAPTQAQLKGDPQRRDKITGVLQGR
jgi:hypothetical protein